MLKLEYKDYTLDFKFEAGTSRGVLKKHPIYVLKLSDSGLAPFGYGEAAPLLRLSVDDFEGVGLELERLQAEVSKYEVPESEVAVYDLVEKLTSDHFPSVKMALETALLDLLNGGVRKIFDNAFYNDRLQIPINGLIWMEEMDHMRRQVDEKLKQGFNCIKIKVGAIKWEEELGLIDYLRSQSRDVTIRLDANGGFPNNEVLARLKDLDKYHIHSIEQPIMPRQPEAMKLICERSKIPIALDEELIGVTKEKDRRELLDFIKPSFIILKPTLLGGYKSTLEWMDIAKNMGIDWWMTSALESNIGLNGISQFAGAFEGLSYQGLGTGQLYHNNIKSPMQINGEYIRYNSDLNWDIPF
ncbi:MAG: o-succinylbenzoate synthase [Cyclobacteriaceae bacterium]